MTLSIGDKAPDFTLPNDEGKEITLSQLRGKKIILYFYPKDNTPGCTKESCDFRDHYGQFEKQGILVFGISKDNAKSHEKFRKKFALPFPLLIDSDGKVGDAYEVSGLLGIIKRTTFLIDENGMIQNIWRKVKVPGHVQEVLQTA